VLEGAVSLAANDLVLPDEIPDPAGTALLIADGWALASVS
jgi:hypothetical protein